MDRPGAAARSRNILVRTDEHLVSRFIGTCLVSRFIGTCQGCAAQRVHAFTLPPDRDAA
ncbi:hypothetical protein [Streptomyces sp. NPDC048438]|uniref:hypothetical protein n=1 Tax=Streptomyces sp. NPDC048438 TaxID=3365551 RepID=UPI0037154FDE